MPVNTKLEQTIAGIQGAASDLKTFSQETNDQQAKLMFNQLAETLEGTLTQLQSRLSYVQSEEPQYQQQ